MPHDIPDSPQIADLAERLLQHVLATNPLDATLLGFREYDAQLADLTASGQAARATARSSIRGEAESIDPATLNEQDAVTRSVIIAQTEYEADQDASGAVEFTVSAFPVAPASALLAFLHMVVVSDAIQAADYLARLRDIPRYLSEAEDRLREGRDTGLVPVAHLVDMSVEQITTFLDTDPCPLALAPREEWVGAEDWRAEQEAVIDGLVRPAFERHRDVLIEEVLPSSRDLDHVGLAHLPDGRRRYDRLVRLHTTTDRTPEELHQVGLESVARIHAEFAELGERILGLSDVQAIFTRLTTDPELRWASSQEILDAAEATVRRAEAASGDWFGRLPVAVCALAPIPELEAASSAAAYYMPPALDGSRPGTYFTNVTDPEQRTRFDLESVAFHEAVPGHHFQISISLETPNLPMIRRLSLFTAYVEGWGLYSERLADEMGLYSSDLQRMGMLSADAWRAARLVVDTGLHAFGWPRQQAVDYMVANTPVAQIEVEAEVDRYIAYPGQALSYMTGRLEIQALRARAEEALGDRFDIRDFHDRVLAVGALPLAVLGEVVDAWIASV